MRTTIRRPRPPSPPSWRPLAIALRRSPPRSSPRRSSRPGSTPRSRATRPAARRSSSASRLTMPTRRATARVEGSPMYVRLIGRDGAIHRGRGPRGPAPGHYTVRIAVPAGGVKAVEIGIHGSRALPYQCSSASPSSRGRSARGRRRSPRPNPRDRARGARSVPAPRVVAPPRRAGGSRDRGHARAAPVDVGSRPPLVLGAARPGGRGGSRRWSVRRARSPPTRGCPAGRPEA